METRKSQSSMIFYESFMLSAIEAKLSMTSRCIFYEGILRYYYYDQLPDFKSPKLRALFLAMRVNLDNSKANYARHLTAVENGKKGGAPRGNRNACKSADKEVEKQAKTSKKTTISKSLSNSRSKTKTLSSSKSVSVSVCKNKEKETSLQTHTQTHTNTHTQGQEKDLSDKNGTKLKFEEKALQERNMAFYNSLIPYIDKYGAEKIRKFYSYWVELSQDRTTMRFENESNWILESRLARWKD